MTAVTRPSTGLRGAVSPVATLVAVVAVAVAAAAPLVLGTSGLLVALRMVVLALFAVAFNVVFGAAGMASLGHAALFGVGGYAAGLGLVRWGWPMPLAVLVALGAGACLGMLFGVATLRTRGVSLLLLTLALAQALWGLAFQQVRVTGGDNGIAGLPRAGLGWFGDGLVGFYWTALVLVVAALAALWWFHVSVVGTVIRAVGMSPSRLRSLGFGVGAYRVTAFTVSGTAAALAGFLYALSNRFVGPENLAWQLSAEVMLFAILGGAAHFAGPVLGTVVVVGAEAALGDVTDRWQLVLGLAFVATLLFVPDGLLGRLERWRRERRGAASDGGTP
jgi:branched-chain amino acid transport system permease protein